MFPKKSLGTKLIKQYAPDEVWHLVVLCKHKFFSIYKILYVKYCTVIQCGFRIYVLAPVIKQSEMFEKQLNAITDVKSPL